MWPHCCFTIRLDIVRWLCGAQWIFHNYINKDQYDFIGTETDSVQFIHHESVLPGETREDIHKPTYGNMKNYIITDVILSVFMIILNN